MSSLLTVKLRRDLRAVWPRIVMMVASIAVSLTVFSAVLYTWSASTRETERAYLSTEPASATISLNSTIEAGEMTAIAADARKQPGVVEAAGRTQFTGRIQDGDGEWRDEDLQVFAAPPGDPMRMANFEVREGKWPSGPGEVMLGEDTLHLLEAEVGDTLTVEAPVKTPRSEQSRLELTELRVAGVVYDPSLEPADLLHLGQGYVSTESLAALGEPDVLDQLKIQVADGPGKATATRDRERAIAVASSVAQWLKTEYGLAIREVQVPEPYEHPHQKQTDVLLLSLLAGGFLALLLSTLLTANMLNGLFSQQIPQIGIMKAIGARSGRIVRLYLAMTLAVAVAATLLALVPGILIGRAGVSALLSFLSMEPTSLAAPWWNYLVVIAAGLLLPVLMALIPLFRTSLTTVRAAIDHRGLGPNPRVATGLLARLGRLRRFNRGLLMALRNTVRRPARFLLSAGLLASAGMVFVSGLSLSSAMGAIKDEASARNKWDVQVRLNGATAVDALAPVVEKVPDVSRVEGWTGATAVVSGPEQIPLSRTYPDQGHGRVSVTAPPDDTAMLAPPKLLEGRWLKPGETGAIVLNQIAQAESAEDVGAGDTVELLIGPETTKWRVAGVVEERGGDANGRTYTTPAGYAEAMGQPLRSNTLHISTEGHDEDTREAVAAAVEKSLTDAGIRVQAATSIGELEKATEGHTAPMILILLALSVAMAVVGFIGLASTMSANILERTREIGVMHALGARSRTVRRVVVAEGVFLALISCLVAIIPTVVLIVIMSNGLGNLFMDAALPFRISVLAVLVWTVLVVLGAVLATDAAANRASRLTVREALSYL